MAAGSRLCRWCFVLPGADLRDHILAVQHHIPGNLCGDGNAAYHFGRKASEDSIILFGKKDLADLTSTIMADCTALETAFSHFIPPFAGSLISTVLIAVSLFFFDWAHGGSITVGTAGCLCYRRAFCKGAAEVER